MKTEIWKRSWMKWQWCFSRRLKIINTWVNAWSKIKCSILSSWPNFFWIKRYQVNKAPLSKMRRNPHKVLLKIILCKTAKWIIKIFKNKIQKISRKHKLKILKICFFNRSVRTLKKWNSHKIPLTIFLHMICRKTIVIKNYFMHKKLTNMFKTKIFNLKKKWRKIMKMVMICISKI